MILSLYVRPSVHLSVCLRISISLSLSSLAPHSSVRKGEGTRGKEREREKTKRRWAGKEGEDQEGERVCDGALNRGRTAKRA